MTSNRATLTPDLLERYDIIVLQQLTTPLTFPKEVLDAVETWVKAGGRLVLVGHAGQWEKVNPPADRPAGRADFPLNRLAERFGFRFLGGVKGEFPLRNRPHAIIEGVPELTPDTSDPRARLFGSGWMNAFGVGLIEAPPDAQVLIADAQGRPMMAIKHAIDFSEADRWLRRYEQIKQQETRTEETKSAGNTLE